MSAYSVGQDLTQSAVVQKQETQLRAERRSFWRVPCIRNALYTTTNTTTTTTTNTNNTNNNKHNTNNDDNNKDNIKGGLLRLADRALGLLLDLEVAARCLLQRQDKHVVSWLRATMHGCHARRQETKTFVVVKYVIVYCVIL